MPSPITDEAFARRMLVAALGGEPQLSEERIDDLMSLAVSTEIIDGALVSVYTEGNLNRAASRGWQDKAALTVGLYDLGGGPGKTLDRSQHHAHCMQMAAWYADGTYSVLGSPGVAGGSGKSGIGVITVGSSLSEDWSL